ncbi:unnamed protein product [Litomosoides sigmodontis]|uniref:Uncharacterized protein n=1 Tax=Litomosoides sigmodontis TaxID=42156 RepID=A0A3P6T0S3_LITSI|nr:unnamed protein product [Litomosoides sigmodontis]
MVRDDLITEWRKQRKTTASSSDIGLRPLYDSSINSEEYQPSVEPVIYPNESITCCKHGVKCSEYHNQEKKRKEISSLWPISELFASATNSVFNCTAKENKQKCKIAR